MSEPKHRAECITTYRDPDGYCRICEESTVNYGAPTHRADVPVVAETHGAA